MKNIGRTVAVRVEGNGETYCGHISFTHATVGETVSSIRTVGRGRVKGPFTVVAVDVPFEMTPEWIGNAAAD